MYFAAEPAGFLDLSDVMTIYSRIAAAVAAAAMTTGLSVLGGGVAHAGPPPPGQVCAIQTSGGFYIEATFGGGQRVNALVTDQRGIGDNLKFRIVDVHDATHVALQTHNGNYVTAENSGGLTTADTRDVLHTDATLLQDWEKFTLVPQFDSTGHEDGTVAIRTFDGRHYVTALGAGGQHSAAFNTNATRVGSWEKFRLTNCTS